MAAQGAVLLKNGDAVLPLTADDHVAVFGRCQKDYYRSGTGSGGAVNVLYTTNLVDGLRDNGITVNEALSASYETWISSHPFDNGEGGWACEPWCQLEMPVTQTLAATAADSNKAVVVIGRTAGEDRDNAATEGSYYLTSTEKEMLRNVYSHFKNVIVVLNVSNIIDMNFMQDSDQGGGIGMAGRHGRRKRYCGRAHGQRSISGKAYRYDRQKDHRLSCRQKSWRKGEKCLPGRHLCRLQIF